MFEENSDSVSSEIQLGAIIATLFKHKWKISIFAIIGLVLCVYVIMMQVPIYQSDAKLFVRYVLDRTTVDPVESTNNTRGSADSVIHSEVEILTSWDLAIQVVEAIGIDKILPNSKNITNNKVDAASAILSDLKVSAIKGSNVILISYRNRDPALAVIVLEELVNRYLTKHLEIHRSAGAFDFVAQQTDQMRAKLNQTEDELKRLKVKAQVISLDNSAANLSESLAKIKEELYKTEADVAEQRARVSEMEKMNIMTLPVGDSQYNVEQSNKSKHQPNSGDIQQYEALVVRLAQMRQGELDLLAKYTSENAIVRLNKNQILELENQRQKMEDKFPSLVAKSPVNLNGVTQRNDLDSERTKLVGIEAKILALKKREVSIADAALQFSEIAPQISQLERKREIEETDYKYFGASLEKARIDEALDPSKIPNISTVQKPSPAIRIVSSYYRTAIAIAVCFMTFGIIISLVIDYFLNKTIKTALDAEKYLQVPLWITVPYVERANWYQKNIHDDKATEIPRLCVSEGFAEPWRYGHFIRPFAEALRDRLVLYFEIKKMVYKPKLIAITSCTRREGVSTVAAGLAASLSETGDGKVLLVDMNVSESQGHHFFEGKKISNLTDAIEGSSAIPSVAENLYLAKASLTSGALHIVPKRFYDLIPHFKATDFDYIIFDMPPLSQGSIALAMSGFMDKVLVVIESEKCRRDLIKRAFAELATAKADVSVVFNKVHNYLPKWLSSNID